ncbi:MAG: flagellar associated protein [Monoraphidium minutum]|nr:MAG: flagellar associated protein [Monoraphidium minutum]
MSDELRTVSDEQQAQLALLLKENEHIQQENQLLAAFADKRRKGTARRKGGEGDEPFAPLTEDEKGDLVTEAMEALEADIEAVREAGEKDVGDIRTLMEEVDLRIGETKNATYEFKREIILNGEDAHTGVISADRVVRYWEDKIYSREVLLEKVNLKNSTYRAAISKLEAQLAHKEEMGEVLHAVDFEQLKIENAQAMEAVGAKNRELLGLKLATGKTAQALNEVKAALGELEKEGARLAAELGARRAELGGFDADAAAARAQAGVVERTFRKLKAEHRDADQPQTMDYIRLKHQVDELTKAAAEWRRKVEVAQLAAGGGRAAAAATAAAARRR